MISQLPILLFCYIIPGICTPVPFAANCEHRKVINSKLGGQMMLSEIYES